MQTCALIPAAGNGSRLGLSVPKLLAPVRGSDTVWTLLRGRLRGVVDHIHVVASPAGQKAIERAVRRKGPPQRLGQFSKAPATSVSIQRRPTGMGDAVFCGHDVWRQAKTVLVIWGDQVHVSAETLRSAVALHEGAPRRVVLPLVEIDNPYVAYCFDRFGRLSSVLQRREGDHCPPRARSDVGTFALSTGGLRKAWVDYARGQPRGALTCEVNFLPFLVYLAGQGWEVLTCDVRDPLECRGINTRGDLESFQALYRHSKHEAEL
jgi:bifunctional UDP-N-acetylglucosamine pyrophosphorylase / glucosamine-1-phosphate N-acetyltransferase